MTAKIKLEPTVDDIAYLHSEHNVRFCPHLQLANDPIRNRIIMERAVIRRALQDIIGAGCWVRVWYGQDEGFGCARTDNIDVAMAAAGACDDEYLHVFNNSSDKLIGSLYFVYGNSGWDVIADNSLSLEPLLAGVNTFVDEMIDYVGA
jgi:hypothetical protein